MNTHCQDSNLLDVARDFCKQQIVFAGILVSLTIAFFPQNFENFSTITKFLIFFSWISLLLSASSGLLFLGRVLNEIRQGSQESDKILKKVSTFSQVQIYSLWIGLALLASGIGIVFFL